MSIPTLQLLDGTSMPWLAWGNGTALGGSKDAIEEGRLAIEFGINHIDTAQFYKTETEAREAVRSSSVRKDQAYVTSKLSWMRWGNPEDLEPLPLDEVRTRIEGSIERLRFTPDLYQIHGPTVGVPGELRALWKIFEELKDEGNLKSIGVSNFKPQDLEMILADVKHKPVVNQLEFHPYTLEHISPILAIHEKHGIVTQAYTVLAPLFRHPTGGPLKPVLERIAARLSQEKEKPIDAAAVLFFWARAQNVAVVTASGNPQRIERLTEIARFSQPLTKSDIAEINNVGKRVHFRFWTMHMTENFPAPELPSQ